MNLLDLIPIFIIIACAVFGAYRGFTVTSIKTASFFVAWLLALLLYPLLAGIVGSNNTVDTFVEYTEGAQKMNIGEEIDLPQRKIESFSEEEIDQLVDDSSLVYPFDKLVKKMAKEQRFEKYGVETIGEYFDTTVANASLNIICFIILFTIFRIGFGVAINVLDYRNPFPVLRNYDTIAGAGIGAFNGFLLGSILFALTPIGLTILHTGVLNDFVSDSLLPEFLYKANLFLSIVRGTL